MLWVRHRFTGFLRAVTARLRAWAAGDFAAFLMAMPWVVVLRRGVFWLKRPWLLMLRLRDMSALYRSRQQLAALNPRLRADLGLDDRDVDAELARPLAGAASPWAEDEVKQAVRQSQAIGHDLAGTGAGGRSFYQARGAPTPNTSPAYDAVRFPAMAVAIGCGRTLWRRIASSSLHDPPSFLNLPFLSQPFVSADHAGLLAA